LIDFHATPVVAVPVREKPVAMAVARARMECEQQGAATRRHEFFRTNDLDRRLIQLLDGTHDRDNILDKLVQIAVVGELQVHKDNQRLTDPTSLRAALATAVENALERYSGACLLKE